jgi:hypothetical protein
MVDIPVRSSDGDVYKSFADSRAQPPNGTEQQLTRAPYFSTLGVYTASIDYTDHTWLNDAADTALKPLSARQQ